MSEWSGHFQIAAVDRQEGTVAVKAAGPIMAMSRAIVEAMQAVYKAGDRDSDVQEITITISRS